MTIRATLILLALSRTAAADELVLDRTCAEIDATTDQLAAPDRERAAQLLRRVLERADQLVVTTACTESFVLSHERDGDAYVIRMRSSSGKRRMKVPAISELSVKYERLARSLLDAKAVVTDAGPTAAPANAPPQALAPEAQPAAAELSNALEPLPTAQAVDHEELTPEPPAFERRVWYAMLGAQLTGGPRGSFGFRLAGEKAALDLALNIHGSEDGLRGHTWSAEALRMVMLSDRLRGYVGGGLSAGGLRHGPEYYGDGSYYWGEGIHGELTAGLHFGRARSIQLLAQLDVTIPFYTLGNDRGDHMYTPTAVLSGGLGF